MATALQFTQSIADVISVGAAMAQQRYNKHHKSVYNLSYDMVLLKVIRQIISIYTSINYKYNKLISKQLIRRYPLFYKTPKDIPVSQLLTFLDLSLLVSYLMLQGQLFKYNMTRHTAQGVSIICLSFLMVLFGFLVLPSFVFAWLNIHKFVALDHINLCWIAGNAIHVTSMWPQISINWMGQCCTGLSMGFVALNGMADVLRIVGFIITSKRGLPFYSWLFNGVPVFVAIMDLLNVLVIITQRKYWYRDYKPRLPAILTLTHLSPA